jgi:hypothetical protein
MGRGAPQPVQAACALRTGPVLDLDDVIGGKVCALASRGRRAGLHRRRRRPRPRGYSVAQLTGLALALDPGVTAEDFADVGQHLDHLGDDRFARYGSGHTPARSPARDARVSAGARQRHQAGRAPARRR